VAVRVCLWSYRQTRKGHIEESGSAAMAHKASSLMHYGDSIRWQAAQYGREHHLQKPRTLALARLQVTLLPAHCYTRTLDYKRGHTSSRPTATDSINNMPRRWLGTKVLAGSPTQATLASSLHLPAFLPGRPWRPVGHHDPLLQAVASPATPNLPLTMPQQALMKPAPDTASLTMSANPSPTLPRCAAGCWGSSLGAGTNWSPP
jgi:hypothetical protein